MSPFRDMVDMFQNFELLVDMFQNCEPLFISYTFPLFLVAKSLQQRNFRVPLGTTCVIDYPFYEV